MRVCVLIIAVAGFGFVPAATPQENGARDHLRRGVELAQDGDTAAALAALERAVQLDPNLAEAYFEIGRLYGSRAPSVDTDYSDRLKAEEALLRALSLDPDNPRYLLALGRLRVKQHMSFDARRILQTALTRSREQGIDDLEFLAGLHYDLGRLSRRSFDPLVNRRLVAPLASAAVRHPDESALLEEKYIRRVQRILRESPPVEGQGECRRGVRSSTSRRTSASAIPWVNPSTSTTRSTGSSWTRRR